jgi:hypothetical protein
MAAKDIVREDVILEFLGVTASELATLRSAGLPYCDLGDDNRLYNLESVATWVMEQEYFSGEYTVFFPVDPSVVYNGHSAKSIATNSDGDFGEFLIPPDFGSLVSLELIGIPASGAHGSGKSITLESNYGGDDESCTEHNETDTDTYTISDTADYVGALDLSAVFSELAAGDVCGVNVKHNSIGASVYYLGVKLTYSKGS